jgi:tetratricopeptide (TPR) repeat protein
VTQRPRHRLLLGAIAALAIAAAALVAAGYAFAPALVARHPELIGLAPPRAGAAVEVSWGRGGLVAVVVDPLDPPLRWEAGVLAPRIAGVRWSRALAAVAGDAAGAESRGEEQAAAELYASGDLDRAIARAKLAREICPSSGLAAAIAGSALLERGVRRYRTGDQGGAAADLDAALARLTDPDERARALLARGLVAEERGAADVARRSFEGAIAASPSHPAAARAEEELRSLDSPR